MIISVKKHNGVDGTFSCYQVTTDNPNILLSVPHNDDNRDYQEIQEWVAEGNTIEEAD